MDEENKSIDRHKISYLELKLKFKSTEFCATLSMGNIDNIFQTYSENEWEKKGGYAALPGGSKLRRRRWWLLD